jgi:hypothetical protein
MIATPSTLIGPHPDRLTLERELGIGSGTVSIPWIDRPFLSLPTAAALLGCSSAKLYSLEAGGKIEFRRVAGRTVVVTEGIIRMIRDAEPWTPSGKTRAAITQRARNALVKMTPPEKRGAHAVAQQAPRPRGWSNNGDK